jgi:hypothetical protein
MRLLTVPAGTDRDGAPYPGDDGELLTASLSPPLPAAGADHQPTRRPTDEGVPPFLRIRRNLEGTSK